MLHKIGDILVIDERSVYTMNVDLSNTPFPWKSMVVFASRRERIRLFEYNNTGDMSHGDLYFLVYNNNIFPQYKYNGR